MRKSEELSIELTQIADTLENFRLKLYQTQKEPWETDSNFVDDTIFSLQSQIRNVAETVEYMDFVDDEVIIPEERKLNKQCFEKLDNIISFVGTLMRYEDFEIVDDVNLTKSIKKLGRDVKDFEKRTGYKVKDINLETHGIVSCGSDNKEGKINDIMIQFARLWGQLEATVITAEDEDISDELKQYDSEEVLNIVKKWADEYFSDENDIEDSCEFFYNKVHEIMSK